VPPASSHLRLQPAPVAPREPEPAHGLRLHAGHADHARRVYDSALGLLPDVDNPTPLVRLGASVGFRRAEVYAKLEWYNPFGSMKDRVAANLVRRAAERGGLRPGQRLVEATSGNTGMGLAMVANVAGLRFTATCSRAIPAGKRVALRFAGGEVIALDDRLCPAPGAPEGAMALAAELGREEDCVHLDQYTNHGNPDAHFQTTGPEIWRQTQGRVTHLVAALGTCGSITGTGRYLRSQNPAVRVIGVCPTEGHDIPGVRSRRQLAHAALFAPDEYDAVVEVGDREAYARCRALNEREGLIAGPSSGLALEGALAAVPDEEGVVAVVLFPDNVFKYAASMARHFADVGDPAEPDAEGAPSHEPADASTSDRDGALGALLDAVRRSPDAIDAGALDDLLLGGEALVVDIREEDAFREGHIEGSLRVSLGDLLDPAADTASRLRARLGGGQAVVVVCSVGQQSLLGALALKAAGLPRVHSLQGGLDGWLAEGLPLVEGA